jgi:putative Mn2+ efflux pump MntP
MSTSQLIIAGLLLGLDSFLVCLAVGALPERSVRRSQLALSFGICDGAATWIGSIVGMERLRWSLDWSSWLGPAAVACYGAYVLFLAWRSPGISAKLASTRWLEFGLPLCLSVDNLFAGLGGQPTGPSFLVPVTFGVISGGLALIGMAVGSFVARRSHLASRWTAAVLLLMVAGGLALKEALAG